MADSFMWVALAVAGTLMIAIRWVLLAILDINVEVANATMERLLARGDRARALKLCEAVSGSVYWAATKDLLQASMDRSAEDKDWVVREALERAWDHALAAQEPRLRRAGWLVPLGLLTATVAVIAAFLQGQLPLSVGVVLTWLAAFLWLACALKRKGIRRGLAHSRGVLIARLTAFVLNPMPPDQAADNPTKGPHPTSGMAPAPSSESAPSAPASRWRTMVFFIVLVSAGVVIATIRILASYPSGTVSGEIQSAGAPHGDFWFRPLDCFNGSEVGFEGVWVVSKLEGFWSGHTGFRGGLKIVRDGAGWSLVLESPLGCDGFRCPQRSIEKRDCRQLDVVTRERGWLVRQDGHARLDCAFPEGGTLKVDVSFKGCAELMRSGGDVD
jgi:hypothetical protein